MQDDILQPIYWAIVVILGHTGATKMLDHNYLSGGILIGIAILFLIVYIIWVRTKFRLLSITDAVKSSQIVWGFWYSGGEIVQEQLAKNIHVKRILIPQVINNADTLTFLASLLFTDIASGIKQIKAQIEALKDSIGVKRVKTIVREHIQTFTYEFTIFDKTPIGNKPCSENAWVLVQVLEPKIGTGQQHRYVIRNRDRDKDRFMYFYNLFDNIWENKKL